MFRHPTPQNVPRAKPPVGKLGPLPLPYKGLNVRSPFAVMEPEYAVSMVNLISEPYGLRVRKGFVEWATDITGDDPITSILPYFPATSDNKKVFAAKGGSLYDVTLGGVGPWTAEEDVTGTSDWWTYTNFQNLAGAYLCITNDEGGYAYYNGTVWATPDTGDITGVDPAKFAFVLSWKKRLWFIEKDSTRAWYLPVSEIIGAATAFDFGEQFKHGGHLAALGSWTVDGGDGLDDHLVAISSQGDVVIYKGIDPNTAETFQIHGAYYAGPLPAGRRQLASSGGDLYILSQLGLVPLSRILAPTSLSAGAQQHISYQIDPLIASLMRDYSDDDGWQLMDCPKEELFLIGVPHVGGKYGGTMLAYKGPTQSWSVIADTGFTSLVNIGSEAYAGTLDGRVVKAFSGPLDNVLIGASSGNPVICQVTPAYSSFEVPGVQKVFMLLRPTFIATVAPSVTITVLTDYSVESPPVVSQYPKTEGAEWGSAVWNVAVWAGLKTLIKEWFGVSGVGFAATAQIDFSCGGDTLLTSTDFWYEEGKGAL
jgi:hypothetical protein